MAKIRGMRQVPKETNLSLNIQRQEKKVEYAVDLSDNRMSPERFPFTVWAKIGREIMSDHKSELMEPSPAGGTRALREAVAEHLKSYRAMLVDPDQIVVGAGTEYLYSLLVQLLAPRSTYCLELIRGIKKSPRCTSGAALLAGTGGWMTRALPWIL